MDNDFFCPMWIYSCILKSIIYPGCFKVRAFFNRLSRQLILTTCSYVGRFLNLKGRKCGHFKNICTALMKHVFPPHCLQMDWRNFLLIICRRQLWQLLIGYGSCINKVFAKSILVENFKRKFSLFFPSILHKICPLNSAIFSQ